jgi:hypothetical protein
MWSPKNSCDISVVQFWAWALCTLPYDSPLCWAHFLRGLYRNRNRTSTDVDVVPALSICTLWMWDMLPKLLRNMLSLSSGSNWRWTQHVLQNACYTAHFHMMQIPKGSISITTEPPPYSSWWFRPSGLFPFKINLKLLILHTVRSRTSDQPIARPLSKKYTNTKIKRGHTFMPRVGFKRTIALFKIAKTFRALTARTLLWA